MVKKFRNIEISDRAISDFQKNTDETVGRLTTKPIVDGVFLKNLEMTSSTRVEHKLARNPLGFIVVRSNANANYWESSTTNTLPDKYLLIDSSVANSIVSLWVF